jgi:hypothetical protein
MPAVTTGFLPSKHGFPFPNCFPAGVPVLTLPGPLGRLCRYPGGGVCGGMVFVALDHFLHGVPVPAEPTDVLFRHLWGRLLGSWNFPFGVLKYYDWQRRPLASAFVGGVRVRAGTTALTVDEWPRIRAHLDAGMPAPLGLVQAAGYDPRRMARHHQVLATGYDLSDDAVSLHVYDPNWPGDDALTLTVPLRAPDAGAMVAHGTEGPTIRGLFLAEYRRPDALPEFPTAAPRLL